MLGFLNCFVIPDYCVITDLCITPEWLTAIGTLLVAFIAVILAIFHEQLRTWLWKPSLLIEFKKRPPDCHRIQQIGTGSDGKPVEADAYYFRIRVHNKGEVAARKAEVFLEEILGKKENGSFEKWTQFLPMNLFWTHISKPFFPIISPTIYKHCEIGYILKPSQRGHFVNTYPREADPNSCYMCLDLIAKPPTETHLLWPATYRLKLVAVAENAKPIRRTLELTVPTHWPEDENSMLNSVQPKLLPD